ncbi:MAG: hypothetical protein OXI90_11475 [Gammaproteobacteria bacterium]|nr:hypothetical protein [Gammaproteobacteria bacterium]
MTACGVWVKRLVMASPEEFSGMVETKLSRHVRDCPRCAAKARRILSANEALRVAISGPEVDAAGLIERAHHAGADETATGRKRWPTVPKLVWSAMAAASVTAAALIVVPLLRTPVLEPLSPHVRPQPLVDAIDYNLVVMPTRNPDITILWYYKETEQ